MSKVSTQREYRDDPKLKELFCGQVPVPPHEVVEDLQGKQGKRKAATKKRARAKKKEPAKEPAKYMLLSKKTPVALEEATNHFLTQGWVLVGGPTFGRSQSRECWVQALRYQPK